MRAAARIFYSQAPISHSQLPLFVTTDEWEGEAGELHPAVAEFFVAIVLKEPHAVKCMLVSSASAVAGALLSYRIPSPRLLMKMEPPYLFWFKRFPSPHLPFAPSTCCTSTNWSPLLMGSPMQRGTFQYFSNILHNITHAARNHSDIGFDEAAKICNSIIRCLWNFFRGDSG